MKLAALKKLLNKKCHHHEEWHCGPATISIYGRDPNPRFDCRMDIYFEVLPYSIKAAPIAEFLKLLDKIGGRRFSIK